MPAAPNALLMLLRNELRLYLRSAAVSGTSIAFLIVSQLLLHAAAVIAAIVSSMPQNRPMAPGTSMILLTSGLLAMLLLMTSRSLAGAVQSLYTRGDLDLLLSSPVDRRAVIGVRMAAIALTVALEVALLVWPFANVFVLFGRVAWAKAYLLVPGMAMLATSIGLVLTMLSFRFIGPRRTRVAVQVMAVAMGVGMMLAFYLPQLQQRQAGRPGRPGDAVEMLVRSGGGEYRDLLTMPAQWVAQGYLPTLAFLLASVALLALTIHLLGDRMVAMLTAIGGGGLRKPRRAGTAAGSGELRMKGGFRRVVVFKELKLIARDPFLIAQLLAQSIYALPMAFMLWRSNMDAQLPMAWLAVVVLAAGLAAPLSWLTILAEDAPDLLASAPVSRAALVRAKIEAALFPVLPICVLPLLFAARHPLFAITTSLCATGAAVSAALINMRNPTVKRRDSFRTRYKGAGASGFLEILSMLLWLGLATGLAFAGRFLVAG